MVSHQNLFLVFQITFRDSIYMHVLVKKPGKTLISKTHQLRVLVASQRTPIHTLPQSHPVSCETLNGVQLLYKMQCNPSRIERPQHKNHELKQVLIKTVLIK
jgi:hypothetical protein